MTVPVHNSDGLIYSEVVYFKNNGFDRGYNTLVPVIPIALYSILDVYNIPLLFLSLISTLFLIISLYLLIKLIFGYEYAIFLIFLFPIIFERLTFLAPYPLFMFLFTASFYLFVKATQTIKKEKFYFLSALFLSLAIYSFTLSLVLSIIPSFFLICSNLRYKIKLKIFCKYYSYLALLLLPWFYWHLSIGGFKYFYYASFNWYVVKALPIVNEYFWGYGSLPPLDLLHLYISELVPDILLLPGIIFIALGLLNYNKFSTVIKFSVLWIFFYPFPFALDGVSAFPRYFFPLVIPLILIASAGLVTLKNYHKRALHFILVLILIFGILSININYFSNRQIENRFQPSSSLLDFEEFRSLVDNNKSIFFRHHGFQYIYSNNFFVSQFDMSEEDALKLISWSSDSDVKEIFKKYNIGWIILYNNEKKWEHDHYVWITILYGEHPKHYERIKNTNFFKQVRVGNIYTLYKFIDDD